MLCMAWEQISHCFGKLPIVNHLASPLQLQCTGKVCTERRVAGNSNVVLQVPPGTAKPLLSAPMLCMACQVPCGVAC